MANFGGINKFDGYEFSSYNNEFGDSTSVSDNSVWTIYEKKDSSLWFGTKTGLSAYNRNGDKLTNYLINRNNRPSNSLAEKALFEDDSGRFYVDSEGESPFV